MKRAKFGLVVGLRSSKQIVVFAMMPAMAPGALAQQPDRPPSTTQQLSARITQLRSRVTQLAGRDNLVDTLHFGWFDRPYARASLAVLVKSAAILQRELHLRELGNGAMADDQVRTMLQWADHAVERITSSYLPSDFRPHRLLVTGADLASPSATPALFAFADAATATRHHPVFGDLDLLASMGLRVYARVAQTFDPLHRQTDWAHRANKLGMATVLLEETHNPSESVKTGTPAHTLTLRVMTLRAMLTQRCDSYERPGRAVAVLDSVEGESWADSLARRALARGALARPRFLVAGWRPPCIDRRSADDPALIEAAMWVHALEGQSLGVVRGWRDLRDGSPSPYRSIAVHPARIETLAHAALDILRAAPIVTSFRTMPRLALVVTSDAVDLDDPNAWAQWIEPVLSVLLERGIRFDVVPQHASDAAANRYPVVFAPQRDHVGNLDELLDKLVALLAAEGDPPATLIESDGSFASGVWVRHARTAEGARCMAIANLTRRHRELKLPASQGFGSWRDILRDEGFVSTSLSCSFDPWQVRIIQSSGPGSAE